MSVSRYRIGCISESSGVYWIAEYFNDPSIVANDSHCIPFIGIYPNIPSFIQGDPICPFKDSV
jgi:hypothetical protein